MLYLLDTDICIWILRRSGPAVPRFRSHSPDDLAIASMSVAELRFGALNRDDPARELARVEAFLSGGMPILPFDSEAAHSHADIRHALRAKPIGERDLVIASTALANGARLVTGNLREFGRVPGLICEDWTKS